MVDEDEEWCGRAKSFYSIKDQMTGQYKSRYPVQHFGVPVDTHGRLAATLSSLNAFDWDVAARITTTTSTTTTAANTIGGPVVIPPADRSPEMDQTLMDVVEQADRGEGPMSDGLVVDDGVAGNDNMVDDQVAFLGQRGQHATLGHGRNADHSPGDGPAVLAGLGQDPIADLDFGSESGFQSRSQSIHGGVAGHQLVQQPIVFRIAVVVDQIVDEIVVVVAVVGHGLDHIYVFHQILIGHRVNEVAGGERDTDTVRRFQLDKVTLFGHLPVQEEQNGTEDETAVGAHRLDSVAYGQFGQFLGGAAIDQDGRIGRETATVTCSLRRFCQIITKFNINFFVC